MKKRTILTLAAVVSTVAAASFYVVDSRHESAVRGALPALQQATSQLAAAASKRAELSGEQSYLVGYVSGAADGFKGAAAELIDQPNQSARTRFGFAKADFERARSSLYCASAVLESNINAQVHEYLAQRELAEADAFKEKGRFYEAASLYGTAQRMASMASDYYTYMFMGCMSSGLSGSLNAQNHARANALYSRAKQGGEQIAIAQGKEKGTDNALLLNGDRQTSVLTMIGQLETQAAIMVAQRAKAIEAAGDDSAASSVYAIAAKWAKDGVGHLSARSNEQDDARKLIGMYGSWADYTKAHSEMPLLERTWESFKQVEKDSQLF
jgi:tetratricopeptide (TPR) repeat protein